ncbi:uncharacterized protein [Haliotis asinina]|uniref:uncharacterized protein n=1 Tax=Haliotis asinina TaxID=109174 RepID=UPI0035317EC3
MTIFDSRLFFILLVALAPSLRCVPNLRCDPAPSELPDKLQELLGQLQTHKTDFQCTDFQCVFDIFEEQCPCQTPEDPDCFEASVLNINSTLCDLISDLNELIDAQPDDCPPLEGCAVLVAGCMSSDIAQVDPVGTILASIGTDSSVSALTVTGSLVLQAEKNDTKHIAETIVFCDVAGGLWTYNLDTESFKLLHCNVDACCDVKINRCSWLIYVAYPSDQVLDIFNHTSCESEGTLTYTTSTPKACPRLDFKTSCV